MKLSNHLKTISISILFAAGLAACDNPKPAETVGKKIDQTANDAGKTIGETVDKVDKKMEEQGDKSAIAIDDTAITTKVKAAIFAEPGLKTLQISVDTVKGVVTLSGSVDSPASADKAKALASEVAGVIGVENKLVPTTSK